MASADHDSSFSLRFISLDGSDNGSSPEATGDSGKLVFFDLNSDSPLPAFNGVLPPPPTASAPLPKRLPTFEQVQTNEVLPESDAGIWIQGDSLMCRCPDCRAPMTIRIWLMVADCWNCRTSIELTEEQEREAMRLMKRKATKSSDRPQQPSTGSGPNRKEPATQQQSPATPEQSPNRKTKGSPAQEQQAKQQSPAKSPQPPPTPPPTPQSKQRQAGQQSPTQRESTQRESTQRESPQQESTQQESTERRPAEQQPRQRQAEQRKRLAATPTRARIRQIAQAGAGYVWLSSLVRETPAWLVSLVFHLVLLVLLSLLTFEETNEEPFITLSASIDRNPRKGEQKVIVASKEIEFDLPVPEDVNLDDPTVRDAMLRQDQEARQLRLDADADVPLPDIQRVKNQLSRKGDIRSSIMARDPRLRVEMVKKEGGTTMTEAAVARGLRWLATQQQADGSWKLNGSVRSSSAGTALALMPFLGAGQTPTVGQYQSNVAKGVRWLIANQKPDGDMRSGSSGNSGMYAQGQAAIVLCEAFVMSGDEELREPAQKAIDFIVAGQYNDGGWRYRPKKEAARDERGDTSVVGWQVMALQSARAAGLNVDPACLERANHFLDSVSSSDGAKYAYQVRKTPTEIMTAEALLCRMYLGWTKDDPPLAEGIQWLEESFLPNENRPNIYYWYYGTQAFHHYGGEPWEKWNNKMRDILVKKQIKKGSAAGSWPAQSPHTGGQLYETCLAICSLEVYYRHLPIFRQIDLE